MVKNLLWMLCVIKFIKASMIGCGKLGLPCAEAMSGKYDIIGYDITKCYSTEINFVDNIETAVRGRDLIFIAVPTPHHSTDSINPPINCFPPEDFDYTILKQVLVEINRYVNQNQVVILISTVLPGTVRRELTPLINNSRFVYNPYFIALGSVKWNMINPECLIIGTKDGTFTDEANILIDFYKPLMKNSPKIHIGTYDEAECIKVFYNTFISVKIGLVNMIQDVAEKNGNINVDVVTNALKASTESITGPKYLTAGLGDAGACRPKDNIALSWLSQNLNLGYDLFQAITDSREMQAKNLALKLIELSEESNLPIVIHGKSYKPYVPYVNSSYSLLVGFFIEQANYKVNYSDPLTGDTWSGAAVILMAHNPEISFHGTGVKIDKIKYYFNIAPGSIILDPWRITKSILGCKIIHYGNTRLNN